MGVVDRPGWNHVPIASLYVERRLTIDVNFALPFNEIANLFTQMSVASGGSSRRNRDLRDDRVLLCY